MIDVRFATALQMMMTLANSERLGYSQLTSAGLAIGIGATASLARKLLVPLAQAGLVRASLGKNGGVRLARPAEAISLGEIYAAVMGEKRLLAARSDIPHKCDVSSNIEGFFETLATDADDAVRSMLDARTLAQSLDELLARKKHRILPSRSNRARGIGRAR